MSFVDTAIGSAIGVLIALFVKEFYDMFLQRRVRTFLHSYRVIIHKVTGKEDDDGVDP